jgi:hypothetical protein
MLLLPIYRMHLQQPRYEEVTITIQRPQKEYNTEQKQIQNRNSLRYVPPKYNKRFIVV